MTDLDTVEKCRDFLYPNGPIGRVEKDNNKILYRFKVYGKTSIEWMKLLYPLMSIRRKEKISQILDLWNNRKPSGLARTVCSKGHDITSAGSYYLQGNYKMCKICNNKLSSEQSQRNAIKAIAFSRKISLEEAKKIMEKLLEEGSLQ